MGCVPSTNADNAVVARSSSVDSKAQQNVELATKKSAPKVISAPVPVQNIKPNEPEGLTNAVVEKIAVIEEPAVPKLPESVVHETTHGPVLKIERLPSKEIEVQPPVPSVDPVVDDDQLMLDFETFVLFPDVQSVMVDGAVTKDVMQELFSIVDKDADGLVNDQEREDLLELISLSYGAKSKPVTPVSSEAAIHTSPSSVAASTSNEDCAAAGLPPVPLLSVPPTSAVPAAEVSSSSTATTPTGVAAEDSAPQPPVSPVNSEASTSTKSTTGTSGKRKPKVIKFINPELLMQEAKPVLSESRSTDAVEVATPTSVINAPVVAVEVEAREAPPQKKGFMLTRRESFNPRDGTEQGQSRFFNLDAGLLSYMDSTSRKPPFSMTHREIALKGVDVRANKNIIKLIPFAANTGNTEQDEEVDSAREIVILELKNEKECEIWMDAIREHMNFSLGVQ